MVTEHIVIRGARDILKNQRFLVAHSQEIGGINGN